MFFQIFFVTSPKGLLQQKGLWGLLCLNIILFLREAFNRFVFYQISSDHQFQCSTSKSTSHHFCFEDIIPFPLVHTEDDNCKSA